MIPGTSWDKVRAETLRRTLPRLTARTQPWDSVALESQLSTPSQRAFASQQTASTLCSSGAPDATSTRSCRPGMVEGGKGALSLAVACLPPVGTPASTQAVPELALANPSAAHVSGFQFPGHAPSRTSGPIGVLARRRGRSRPEFSRNNARA